VKLLSMMSKPGGKKGVHCKLGGRVPEKEKEVTTCCGRGGEKKMEEGVRSVAALEGHNETCL